MNEFPLVPSKQGRKLNGELWDAYTSDDHKWVRGTVELMQPETATTEPM